MQIIGEIQFEDDTFKEIERIYDEQGFLAAEEEIAHQLEVFAENNSITPADLATAYIYANQPDKAMDWLEKAYEIHDPQMIFLGKNPYYNKLKDNPRYIALLKKMNLPLP